MSDPSHSHQSSPNTRRQFYSMIIFEKSSYNVEESNSSKNWFKIKPVQQFDRSTEQRVELSNTGEIPKSTQNKFVSEHADSFSEASLVTEGFLTI